MSALIVFGTRCEFTSIVLERVRIHGHEIRAFVVPGRRGHPLPISDVADVIRSPAGSALPIARTSTAVTSAGSPQVRTFELNNPHHSDSLRVLTELDADLSVVCCYPARLPLEIVNTAKFGGLNVHPSLLPAYRGPDPLFWMYRNGETQTGVTIHRVDERLDTGEIVRQRRIELPVGLPGDQLWHESARIGGDMLNESIRRIVSGKSTPAAQDHSTASYYTWPTAQDLVIDPAEWEAWRVFHFCRGVLPFGYMPRVALNGTIRRVIAALEYADNLPEATTTSAGTKWVQCQVGAVLLELGPAIF